MIGAILRRRGHLSEDALAAALDEQRRTKERLGRCLVRLGLVEEGVLLDALAEQSGLPRADLSSLRVEDVPRDLIAPRFLFKKEVVPLRRANGVLDVATADPFDVHTLDELRLIARCDVRPFLAAPAEIRATLKRLFGIGADTMDRMGGAYDITLVDENATAENGENLDLAEDASLITFVNQLLLEALRERASDVHIEPGEHDLRVRYRIDGVLHEASTPPQLKRYRQAIVSRLKIMAELDIAEKRLPQDGRIKLSVGGQEVDVRVSIIPMVFGEGVVLRLLDRRNLRLSLADLGMPQDLLRTFGELIETPHGIFLVTGPTGSGKTTTLYAALAKINNPETKIVTVEDPVEYELEGINQIPVRPKIGLTFAAGLRAILRHDPDVILVGEIRDRETAEIAIQASLTGHLVLSTLHTNDAASAVTRLVDMGVEPYLVASTVEGLMAQRLVRRICAACREEAPAPDPAALARLGLEGLARTWRGRGCDRCRGTGYRGRLGIFELIPVDERIREKILSRVSASEIARYAVSRGTRLLREDGIRLVREGETTLDEIVRVTKADRAGVT